MLRIFKKGQAAMEFLMTYGWAILVVLVAIGALAYFGVLNPSRFLPSSCTIAPGIGCDEFKVTTTSIQLVLRNGMGKDLSQVAVDAPPNCAMDVDADGTVSPGDPWVDGGVLGGSDGISLTSCTAQSVGARYKETVNVSYLSGGISRLVQGSITTKVE